MVQDASVVLGVVVHPGDGAECVSKDEREGSTNAEAIARKVGEEDRREIGSRCQFGQRAGVVGEVEGQIALALIEGRGSVDVDAVDASIERNLEALLVRRLGVGQERDSVIVCC